MNRFFSALLAIFVALAVAACAVPGGGQSSSPPEIRQGRIEQITNVSITHPHQVGVGAILGGVAGAGLGSLIGAGSGKDVAIAVGAIAGAVGGNYMEEKKDAPTPGQQIVVRLNSGVLVVVTQPVNPALYVGQRVYVEGAGANASVVPQQ
jgi:outer membrane lipoprotein SlyB